MYTVNGSSVKRNRRGKKLMEKDQKLASILPEAGQIIYDAPMKLYTTFQVGGPADILTIAHTAGQVVEVIRYCQERNLAYVVIGAGSNLLVSDRGFRGVVVKLGPKMSHWTADGSRLLVQAGMRLAALSKKAAELHLTGLEFAEGIPGTVGGGVAMNAGAYGGDVGQFISRVQVFAVRSGEIVWLSPEAMDFSPRQSVIQIEPYVVLQAEFDLQPGDPADIQAKTQVYHQQRADKQPLRQPSAGSVFKRPPGGFYVGTMIESLGLKGFACGGAAVSEKHAGFIVNRGNATATDIYKLIRQVTERVQTAYPVVLEPEIKFIGDFT
jgi:UDP-N-acetylmuramate dehydrogenase